MTLPSNEYPPSSKDESLCQDSSILGQNDVQAEKSPNHTQPQLPQSEQLNSSHPASTGVPNGGLQAWLHVLGGFMLFFNTWGLMNTFGVFQTYYESGALFKESSSNIAWIGSIQAYMLLFVGFLTGPLYDRGYLRTLVVVGSLSLVFGHMMLSLCKTYWQVLLAQGFASGMGAGCLFIPCVSVIPTYFNQRLGLIMGIAASGSAVGAIIYPIVLYQLIDKIGFGWAVRVIAFIALATLCVPMAVMRMRVKVAKPRDLIDWTAFTDLSYMFFAVGAAIGMVGYFISLLYISYFGQNKGLLDTSMSFYILPIYAAASCFGRILPNALSDKVGPFNIVVPGAAIIGILLLCMQVVTSEAGEIVMAVLLGFTSGVFIAMPPVCFVALTKDKSKIGTRMGMGFGIMGCGVLIGGPGGGGALGTVMPLNWDGLWIFAGVTCLAASVMYGIVRTIRVGFNLMVKV